MCQGNRGNCCKKEEKQLISVKDIVALFESKARFRIMAVLWLLTLMLMLVNVPLRWLPFVALSIWGLVEIGFAIKERKQGEGDNIKHDSHHDKTSEAGTIGGIYNAGTIGGIHNAGRIGFINNTGRIGNSGLIDPKQEALRGKISDVDIKNVIVEYLKREKRREHFLHFRDLDKVLKLPTGSSKRMITQSASEANFVIQSFGEETIHLKKQTSFTRG
jgi:hypothetical protein